MNDLVVRVRKASSNIEMIPILTARRCDHGGFIEWLQRALAPATNESGLRGDLLSGEH